MERLDVTGSLHSALRQLLEDKLNEKRQLEVELHTARKLRPLEEVLVE
jgi:rRNA pseudouridine-1189 N-methylase Emg1 (Nep1/Mra1 family)